MRRQLGFLLAAAILGTSVMGCKGGFSDRQSASSTGTLRYALALNPPTFDPGQLQDPEAIEMLGNVYEGLVAYNEKNEVVPQLAESYEGLEGGKVWEFKLREGVKFHNGREVTAEDVKWTLERNLRKELSSPVALNYLSGIVGAQDLADGKADSLEGVEVIDARTVRITLTEPRSYFLGQLTYPVAHVLAKEAAGSKQMVDAKQMIGTGPFKIGEIVPDRQVTLVVNEDYYLGAPKLAKIERRVIADPVTRVNMFKQGQLDYLTLLRSDVDMAKQDPELSKQLVTAPRPLVYYVGMNQSLYKPFRDIRVRRAFAMAINRKRIGEELLGGMPVASGLIAHEVPGFRPDYTGLPYNPAEAKRLLAEAGYPNGKGLPPLELDYRSTSPDSRVVAEGVHSSLTQNLNFPVKLRSIDGSVFLQQRNAGKFPSWFLSWGADYPDPQNFTTFLLLSDSPMNFEKYRNPDFDRIGKQADTTVDQPARLELYQQAEDILIQDVARVPLYYGQDNLLVSPRVKGLRMNLMGTLPHTQVTLE